MSDPAIGEERTAAQIGRPGSDRFRWLACAGCGTARWVRVVRGRVMPRLCRACAKERHRRHPKAERWC